jgi:hypothetical protein
VSVIAAGLGVVVTVLRGRTRAEAPAEAAAVEPAIDAEAA